MGTLVLAGRYEILEKIGDGGMAVVYKARDRQLNRFVAIKILKKEYIADQTFVENFIREAKAAASLLHPNIVTIHDAGKDRDIYYIVMEYVEGRPLSDVIAAEAPLDYKRCIRIAKQIASALSLAHRNNIIHRDVKPHNILMTADGTAKITDFGIAKAVSDGTIINDSGVIMGSVHYFSPEQSRGQYVDEKSDIYSLGIVLYEMMTGRVPFDADNPVTIAVMHMNDTIIPPSRLVKGVPPGLDQIVMKATAKFQSDRFTNIDEMYKTLDNVNFITGVIDDPEIAGFVAPTNMAEEVPEGGHSALAEPEEPVYDDEPEDYPVDDEEPDYRSRSRRSFEDDDLFVEDEEPVKKGGLFGLFGARKGSDVPDGDGGDDGDDGKPKSKLTQKQKMILIIAVIAIAIVLSFPLSKFIMGQLAYEPVRVPNVVGMHMDDATELLTEEGLSVTIITEPLPAPPARSSNSYAASDDLTDLGDLSDLSDLADLADDPLALGDDPFGLYEPEFRVGEVMEQDPEEGEMVRPGSTVTLTVAGAPIDEPEHEDDPNELGDPTEVPELIGMSKSSAEYAIVEAGFRIGTVEYENSDQPVDTVIRQSPRAGDMAAGNSRINFTVSLGARELTTTVPNMMGRTVQEALKMAEEGKFVLEVIRVISDQPVDSIISQNPAANTSVREGATVRVEVSAGAGIDSISVSGPDSIRRPHNAGTSGNFTADVKGVQGVTGFDTRVTWSISGSNVANGTGINNSGVLTIASNQAATTITVTATSRANNNIKGTASVRITVQSPPDPPPPPATYTVRFLDWDNTVLKEETVTAGGSATPPGDPTRSGWTFAGWSGSFTNVQSNVDVIAQYTEDPPPEPDNP